MAKAPTTNKVQEMIEEIGIAEADVDAKITTHKNIASAHHEAITPAQVDGKITTHKNIASAHHIKTGNYEVYANTELVTSDPAADAAHLGRIIKVRTGAGAKTYLKCCVQNDANGYEWIQIGIST